MFLTPVTWGNAQGEHDAVLPLSMFLPPILSRLYLMFTDSIYLPRSVEYCCESLSDTIFILNVIINRLLQ